MNSAFPPRRRHSRSGLPLFGRGLPTASTYKLKNPKTNLLISTNISGNLSPGSDNIKVILQELKASPRQYPITETAWKAGCLF